MRSDTRLTPAQERVLALLATGFTAAAAARSVGVHRNTVGNWLRSSTFREALFQARSDQARAWREQSGSVTHREIGAIPAIMPGPKTAARFGPNQPCPCGSGRKFKCCCMPTN